jgi:Fe-S cluster assembly protein SufD
VSKKTTVNAAPFVEKLGLKATSSFQQQSLQTLLKYGFPTTKVEEWKYTRIDSLLEKDFKQSKATVDKVSLIAGTHALVFVNGDYSAALSNADQIAGVEIKSILEADEKLLSRATETATDAFAHLNGALLDQGTYIKISNNTIVDKALHILHLATEDMSQATVRHLIEVEASAEIEIFEDYQTLGDVTTFNNTVTDIHLAKNATLRHVKNQSQNPESFHIASTNVTLERDSSYFSSVLACGSKLSRNFLETQLNDENASVDLKGLYAVKGNQLADNHTVINHNSARTFSDQLYKGILDDRSRGVFNGKVFIARDAQQVDSSQLNKNLMLSDKARIDTKPELEVYADDVKAAHGAAIGQLNDEEMFYIQSRCISKDAAMAMLVHGHMEEIIETVKSKEIKTYLEAIYLNLFD